jgi:NAD(P)-dependent dehydrogenase (short-subunit alcohol dehydrogenase family)
VDIVDKSERPYKQSYDYRVSLILTLMSISKGVALITGSAQGIGRGIALRLARDGFDIALNDVPTKSTQLQSVATEVENLGRQVCVVPADVSDHEQVKEMVDGAVTKLGGLDVVSLSSILTRRIL